MTRVTLALASGRRIPNIMMKCYKARMVRDFSDSLATVCHAKNAQKYKNLDKKNEGRKSLFCLFILTLKLTVLFAESATVQLCPWQGRVRPLHPSHPRPPVL